MNADSTPVQWSTLTAEQKNQLVATKVMGLDLHCTGRLTYGATDILFQQQVSVCLDCNALVTTKRGQQLPAQHTRSVANYSQSLDTAWLVVRQMNEDGHQYARFIDALEAIVGSEMFFDLFYCDQHDQHLTADRICVAALRAVGVEVQL